MKKQTVFIKRYPSRGELPKDDGLYFTNLTNLGCYYFYTKNNEWEGIQPSWWLEEIELPSEEETTKAYLDYKGVINNPVVWARNFILNKLKGE